MEHQLAEAFHGFQVLRQFRDEKRKARSARRALKRSTNESRRDALQAIIAAADANVDARAVELSEFQNVRISTNADWNALERLVKARNKAWLPQLWIPRHFPAKLRRNIVDESPLQVNYISRPPPLI